MEKEHLYNELANLKCILENYECASENPDVIMLSDKAATRIHLSNSGNFNKKSMIFVNPNKINGFNSTNPSTLANKICQKNVSSTNNCQNESKKENGVKVYINPNFKKSDIKYHCQNKQSYSNVHENQKTSLVSNLESDSSSAKRSGLARPVVHLHDKNNLSKVAKESNNCPLTTNKHKIFINPNFTAGSKMTSDSLRETSLESIDEKINTNANEYINCTCNKPKKCIKLNDFYNNTCTVHKTKSKLNIVSTSKTIFLNPKFESSQNLLNKETCNEKITDGKVLQEKKQNDEIKSAQDCKTNFKRTHSSLKWSNHQCKTTISKTDSSESSNQCVKPHSSHLVALSATKLIRKKKSSLNLPDKGLNNSIIKPAFLSKTKLVRTCHSKSNVTNSKVSKERKEISKNQPHSQSTEQKNHKYIVNSNLVHVTPTSSSIMKIHSKNGKSLRLIRQSVRHNLTPVEWNKVKSMSILQKHKRLLRLQAKKKRIWNDQNKLKKSQYSKMNLPKASENGTNLCTNKYVYRNKTLCSKKSNASYNTLNKKTWKMTTLNNIHYFNSSMITKNTSSKYKFVRKLPHSPNDKLIKSNKNPVPSKTNSVRPNYKAKWKGQNYIKRKSLSIVNIGGVFYKCSRTCLSKNKSTPKKVLQKQNKGPLLNIRGQRFQLDSSGLTLTCLDKTPGRKRIDVGGVTFIGSSSGSSLIRTNYHTARSILVQAKQKSISLLTRKLKKNNEPCPFFHRLGRCTGKERGTCIRLHDSKFVAVCKKFVAGQCADSGCLLSHKISCNNMPTCQHYLAGHCGRDACPYPHVKLSDSAPICLQFLQGFCYLGDECRKRHLEICPSFEKGLCSRGKFCPYPHPKSKSSNQLKGKLKFLKREPQPKRITEVVSNSNLRYFEDVHLQKENEINKHIKLEDCSSEDEESNQTMKIRPRLGSLPSFIPLNSDGSINSTLDELEK